MKYFLYLTYYKVSQCLNNPNYALRTTHYYSEARHG